MIEVEEVLEKLVNCNTIMDKENKKILDYLESLLKKLGFKTQKREKFLIMYNKDEIGLGFLGHTDTVEFTDGWKYEKFKLTKDKNRIYGLGVCDMKSGIAGIISAISQIDFQTLNKGIKLYFTYDEEIGFSGIKDIVNSEKDFPENIIIGEPTNNEIEVGSKGLMEYKICFKGVKAHAGNPLRGKSAILDAIGFINELNLFYEREIKKDIENSFEIPYTTMNIGRIEGGSGINSVPDSCEFFVDFRTINKSNEEKIINKIQELENKYKAKVLELNKVSAFLNKTNELDKTCNYITEASFLKNNKMILGAGPITAHEVDEYITTESLNLLVEQYKELILRYCS